MMLNYLYTRQRMMYASLCMLVMVLGFSFTGSAQIDKGVAPVDPPIGGFAIDGNLKANTPTSPAPFAANQGDWLFGAGGSGGYVLDGTNSGTPLNSSTTFHLYD